MKKIICIIILLLSTFPVLAQVDFNSGRIKQKHYLDTIPYQTQKGLIFIPVQINGKTYKFLFDTGSPLIIYDNIHKQLNLNHLNDISIVDINNTSSTQKAVILPKMKIGNITFLNSTGAILNKGDSKIMDCFEMDGVVGSNILRNSVVQIDSKNHQLIITDKRTNLSVKRKNSQKLILDDQSTPLLKIKLHNKPRVTDEVVFDSGAQTFYTMSNRSSQLFKKHNVRAIDEIAKSKGVSGIGFFGKKNQQKMVLLNIKNISINNANFHNVIVEVHPNSNSRIGSELLKYGKVTIDYNHKRFYFKPFKSTNRDKLSQKPWQIQPTLRNGKLVVGRIWENTDNRNINLGDEILKFEETNYQSMNICEMFLKNKGYESISQANVKLKDVNTGEIKEIRISRIK